GTLGKSAKDLLHALTISGEMQLIAETLYVYANQRFHENTEDSVYQGLSARIQFLSTDLSEALSFMVPELVAIPEKQLHAFLSKEPKLGIYKQHLNDVMRQRKHILSKDTEALLARSANIATVPDNAYSMLTNADMEYPKIEVEKGKEVQLTDGNFVNFFLHHPKQGIRRKALETVMEAHQKLSNTIAALYSGQVQSDLFYARTRGFKTCREAALNANNIPESVYDTLLKTVTSKKNLGLLHRLIKVRKKVMQARGLLQDNKLHMYDLYIPLVEDTFGLPYEEVQEQLFESLQPLGKEYVDAMRKGFKSGWVDVLESKGKRSGAYSWGAYSTMPFILMNIVDVQKVKLDEAHTLIHEGGHSMHSFLSRKNQEYINSNYTIFTAEKASITNERLFNHFLLSKAKARKERLLFLNKSLDEFRTTLFRQTLFAAFEYEAHKLAESGEALTDQALNKIYLDQVKLFYGCEDLVIDEIMAQEWKRIPHFYSPFYVFQYATSICAATTLAQKVLTEGKPAVDRYLGMLKGGCSKYPLDLAMSAGVDMSSPEYINKALKVFEKHLAEFEQLMEEELSEMAKPKKGGTAKKPAARNGKAKTKTK
ncbi:MAG: oligoendopeptidase F, partial [Candidatus Obscuribacterales bacterium]|nr:oligoendopeptidase F [Candidatus Obscuribacterales bacterium]